MKLSLKYLPILTIIQMIFTPLQSQAADVPCGGEPMPILLDRPLVCAINLGITPNTGADISPLISQLMPQNRGIFFPAGKYIISNNIVLGTGNSLIGSISGVTIFHNPDSMKTISIGNTDYSSVVKNLTIKYLILDNIKINFYGNKNDIEIENNAFVNTMIEDGQLSVSHNKFRILGNVFLRDKTHPGIGLSTYKNKNTLIQGNIVGSISDEKRIATLNYYDTESYNVVTKLKRAVESGDIQLEDEQDYYRSAWYATDDLTDSAFKRNVIYGNEEKCLKDNVETNQCLMKRDHAIYIKQYNNVDVINNYFNGWPKDASGSVKFRNATNLYFSGNYLDQVEFDARPYYTSHTLRMDNTFVFNNLFNDAIVSYWQNFNDSESTYINAKNFVVFDNIFEGNDRNKIRIASTWRNTHGEFLEANNLYSDFVPVMTQDFVNIDINEAKSRLPEDKRVLLTLQPLPLWKKIGQISGPDLIENNLVRMDINIKGHSDQFVVYDPPSRDYYPTYRWSPQLAKKLNAAIKGVCAGELTDNVTKNNHCKFMKTVGSSYKNTLYSTEGQSVKYKIAIINKYKKVGSISAPLNLNPRQAIKFSVRFEDGSENEIKYIPSENMRLAHRWPMGLATEINKQIPGLCAGKYIREKSSKDTQCLYVTPIASTYKNDVYSINGQSAVTAMSIVETEY